MAWKMLVFLFIIQFAIAFVARSLAPLGLIIGKDLQLSMSQIGMFPAALFLGQSLISMPAGALTDKIGSKKMILAITLLLSGSFLAMVFLPSFALLLVFITMAGFAYGASHPTTNRGIVQWFPVKERGSAMGIKQMGVTLGSALAALSLLPLANAYGWRIALSVSGCCLLLIRLSLFI